MNNVSNSAMPQVEHVKQKYAINLSKTNGLIYGVRYAVEYEQQNKIKLIKFDDVFNKSDFKIMNMDSTGFIITMEYVGDYYDFPVFKSLSVNDSTLDGYIIYDISKKEGYGTFTVDGKNDTNNYESIEKAVIDYHEHNCYNYWKALHIAIDVKYVVLNANEFVKRTSKTTEYLPVKIVKRKADTLPDVGVDIDLDLDSIMF